MPGSTRYRTLLVIALGVVGRAQGAFAAEVTNLHPTSSAENGHPPKAAVVDGSDSNVERKRDANTTIASRELILDAGHMEIDGAFNRFLLSNGVKLTVHRYRVTADEMTLERTPRGLLVDGNGKVAFCPCVRPPLTVGFTSATVAPPTDLILRNATFRAYGVPFFYLPWFWVRSPNRSGMMSPRLSYRGVDGVFVGTGVHLPLSKRYEPSPEYLDLSFGTYLFSGVELGAQLVTTNTVTNLRWDYLHHGLIEFDAVGHRVLGDSSAVAWRADTLRGVRARTGFVAFEASSRAFDHNRLEIVHATGEQWLSFGIQNTAMRAIPFREFDRWGPSAKLGIGTAIGNVGHVDSSTATYGIVTNASSMQALTVHNASLGFDARPGPFAVKTMAHENWTLGSGNLENLAEGGFGGELRVGLPLVRSFGRSESRFSHWLEPHVISTLAWQHSVDSVLERRYGGIQTTQVGLLNVVGRARSSNAVSLLLRGGWIESENESSRPAFAARWLASGTWLALGGALGTVNPWEQRRRGWMSNLRGRVGRLDKIALSANLEGRSTSEPLAVRWLLDEGFRPRFSQWYATPGFSLGSQLDLNLFDQIATTAGITLDLEREHLLAERLGMAYRHPCGCLAASSVAGWRVGRSGWDVSLLVDLMP